MPDAAFPPAVAATIQWLKGRFGAWYESHPVPLPDRFTRREFGFMAWPERPGPPPFYRHQAYESGERLHEVMVRSPPHSAYYSTAYYRRPGETKMADKEWLGAELIFDLDADHLAEVERAKADGHELDLARQLELVKGQFRRLLDEFLFGDFGLNERDVWITFSGGRGYHAHVVEPRLVQLDARSRREIVDYITGKVPARRGSDEPDLTPFLQTSAVDWRKNLGPRGGVAVRTIRLAPATAGGWPGRLTRAVVSDLKAHVVGAPAKEAVAWLTDIDGIGPKGASDFVAKLEGDPGFVGRLESQAVVSQGPMFQRIALHVLSRHSLPFAKGETDEPVTADTKRLIRLPGSLHGKSGLQVVTLTRDDLDSFDPLRDAVAFGGDQVTIVPRNDLEATLAGERVAVEKGVAVPVPERHAIFWCARQQASVAPPNR
ncbi:MAG: DNA primase small subunit domain-containing protein [Thermoplasmatota archaeon]